MNHLCYLLDLIASRPLELYLLNCMQLEHSAPVQNPKDQKMNLLLFATKILNLLLELLIWPSNTFESVQKYSLLISISNSSLNSNTILTDNVAATSSSLGMETNFNGLTLTSLISKGMIAVNSLKKQEPTIQPEINRTAWLAKTNKTLKTKSQTNFFCWYQASRWARQVTGF